jgi:hypothetical protein
MKNAAKKAYALLRLCETFTPDDVAEMTDALNGIVGPVSPFFVESLCDEATINGELRPRADLMINAVRNYAAFDRLVAEYDTPPESYVP